MTVIAIFAALFVGGAIFASLKNSRNGSKSKITKLDIG